MAQGLIDADHSKLPCLVPNSFKVTLNFDVVRKATAVSARASALGRG